MKFLYNPVPDKDENPLQSKCQNVKMPMSITKANDNPLTQKNLQAKKGIQWLYMIETDFQMLHYPRS